MTLVRDERFFEAVFERSPLATWIVREGASTVTCNAAGQALERAIGVSISLLLEAWGSAASELGPLREALQGSRRASATLRLGFGARAPWLAFEAFMQGEDCVVTARDATADRRAADELLHLRRLESLGLATAGVVHDMNNVLTAVLLTTELISRASTGNDRALALVRELESSAGRAVSLSHRVLRVLRRQPQPAARVSVSALLAEMRSLLQLVAGPRVAIDLRLDPHAGDVMVDREHLEHAVINLVANARDALPVGGTITLATSQVPMAEAPDRGASAYVGLTVTDDGEGMSSDVRERLHERFFTTKEPGRGTGIGLSTVRSFVESSGGCITLASAPGQGTTVVLYLPQAAATAPAPPPSVPSVAPLPGGAGTVVLVEPDDAVRGAVRETLCACGYRVLDAPSGETALRQVNAAGYVADLVLSDVSVPGVGGAGVIAELRARGHTPELLWMSGLPEDTLSGRGIDGPLLRKAFTPHELARAVRRVLRAS